MLLADPVFEEHRAGLQRLAYRMLGSLADADDVLQDAYLRWSQHDRDDVESPRAYLYSIVTRLCIDQRRKIDSRKESYIGPWLPEPLVEAGASMGETALEKAESVSIAFLVVLENLSPLERAAYLLRKVFDYEYTEIGEILEQSVANCRQLVSRADTRIHEGRPRFETDPAEAERITDQFLTACKTGDFDRLVSILADDAVMYSDGGGKVHAALAPVCGMDKVARFFIGITRKFGQDWELRRVQVNGQPGFLSLYQGQVSNVFTLDIVDGKIANCYIIRNPDKMTHITID